ncbi:MAG: hypothetical protein COA79_20190 [Planctomycetota bacterium]|nr:MAG: hypothetical protein COA79_20190 [Planctomycetota bacterium]
MEIEIAVEKTSDGGMFIRDIYINWPWTPPDTARARMFKDYTCMRIESPTLVLSGGLVLVRFQEINSNEIKWKY